MTEVITEFVNKNTIDIDLVSTEEMVRKMNDEDKIVANAVEYESGNIAKAIDIITKQFLAGGRLYYFGAGTSGRIGVLDASECAPTFNVPESMVTGVIAGGSDALKISIEGAEDDFAAGVADANILTEKDVAVAVSASGNPNYLMGVLSRANEIGCKTIGLTCNSKAKIAEEVSHLICVEVGPEVIAGASRMKAGTAQKMVLNMLSTGSMIKIGKTYKNFMIDLQVTNEKMKDRAIRIVSQLAEVQLSEAFAMLLKCDWNVKVAIVALKKQVDKDEAEKLLTVNRGVLRRVLGDL